MHNQLKPGSSFHEFLMGLHTARRILITEIEEHAGRPGHTPSVWLMLPTAHQGLPLIDGVAVPIVNNMQNTRTLTLPQAWVENRHRAGVSA